MAKPKNKPELISENKNLLKELEEAKKALLKSEKAMKKLEKEKGADAYGEENIPKPLPVEPPVIKTGVVGVEDLDIRPDAYIEVVSLCPNPLNLSEGNGNKALRFRKFGESKRILYQKLVAYMDNHPEFTERGEFYILDKRVVRRHGLDDFYDKIIDKGEIEKVINGDPKLGIVIFDSANTKQQENISTILLRKVLSGEHVDKNLIHHVGNTIGIDLLKKAEDSEDVKDLLIKEK